MMTYCFRLPFLFIDLSIVIISTDSILVMLIKCYQLFCYYTLFINCEYYYRGGHFRVVMITIDNNKKINKMANGSNISS